MVAGVLAELWGNVCHVIVLLMSPNTEEAGYAADMPQRTPQVLREHLFFAGQVILQCFPGGVYLTDHVTNWAFSHKQWCRSEASLTQPSSQFLYKEYKTVPSSNINPEAGF